MNQQETAELLLQYLKEKKGLRFFKSKWDVQKLNRMYGLDLSPRKLAQGTRILSQKGILKKISQDRYQIVENIEEAKI